LDKFIGSIKVYSRAMLDCDYIEYRNGGGLIRYIRYKMDYYSNQYKNYATTFPPGVSFDSHNYMFYDDYAPLNGFGMYYGALFIIGNYARYYPDLWMKDIEQSSPLSLVVEELLADAAVALPLLTLSELSRIYYVTEGFPLR
jgi:hypothetical protein